MLPIYNKALQSQYDGYMASRQIDSVTHGLIRKRGWDNLDDDVKELVSKACEIQAIFLFENKSSLSSGIKSVTLGSVSMSKDFDNPDTFYKGEGVIMPMSAYMLLRQAGLITLII